MEKKIICIPGQRLCRLDPSYTLGKGTYKRQEYIFSSLAGIVNIDKRENISVIEVLSKDQTIVPAPGNIVTAMITTLNQDMCKCLITSVSGHELNETYRGSIRKQDVRTKEIDKIEMLQCFRPGDIILAKILPMTEAHTFKLTTAENELGVVIACSEYGHPMIPLSWTEMQCTKTGTVECRKVAKIVQENFKGSF
ncbi:exosome complex component CSL4 [Daktulosphaira vitifoliae]|uniref:exosome complex component CSL4 n=1 Tax=Daktulosphaira vitifoliae TaxID=58002 RepID=UPI0021A9A504|nr:exosome complex component CSL4 [Daktulosphaira vitifoliae]